MKDTTCNGTCSSSSLSASCTVDAVLARYPSSVHVLNAYGVDTCCGGAATIAEAATHIRVEPSELLASIERVAHT